MIIDRNFKEFVQLLNKNRVKYLIVGGYAVALHGHPRYTKDLDIWIYINTDNAERLISSLNEFGFTSLELESNDFLTYGNVVQLGSPPNRIDLLTSVDGVEFESCYESKFEVEIEGIKMDFINLEDLKKNKKASGRYQDLADLENLE
jgi:predicted nucleotidyltransferase